MKASEFNNVKSIKKVDKKVVEDINFLLQQLKPTPKVHTELEENICGVKTSPGHEIGRIRKKNSHLWQKINNWD